MIRHRSALAVVLAFAIVIANTVDAKARTKVDDTAPLGWHARITQKMGVFEDSVESIAPAAAFVLEEEQAPHPSIRAVGWTAQYRTRLTFPQAGTYRLGLEVDGGRAELTVRDPKNGQPIAGCISEGGARVDSQWVKVEGTRDVEVRFERKGRGKARLRTTWEMAPEEFGGFRVEPIPSYVVSIEHDEQLQEGAARGLAAERGRMLLAKKGCTMCHTPGERESVSIGIRRAPNLERTSRYASADWIERWVKDPSAIRAHADMPTLLHSEPDAAATAVDLAAYVSSLAKERSPKADWEPSPTAGRKLFHQLGCVACHGALSSPREVFEDPQQSGEIPVVAVPHPYGDVSGKWTRGGLAEFLRDPWQLHPDGRMPNFALSEKDSRALADFLVERFGSARDEDAAPLVDPARAERGASSFYRLGCDGCHGSVQRDFVRAEPIAKVLGDLDVSGDSGCLSAADAKPARYAFEDGAREELATALAACASISGVAAPVDRMRQTMLGADCLACHRKDGRFGVPSELTIYFHSRDDRVDLGDEGRLPPDLTSVGFKLHTSWMKTVIEGQGIARDYLGVRMPSFAPLRSQLLATGLAVEMGTTPGSDATAPAVTDAMVQHGRTLVGSAGMNCIGCHQYKDDPPVGSPGPKIDEFAARLRYEWWTAYIQQPARFKPGTRMPSFALGRKSTFPTILDGDIYAQGDALWSYFTLGENMPTPEGVAGKDALKLAVGSSPRILRTFLERGGSRAIAVGLPLGIHYSFDAEQVRLVDLWQGDFLDAAGAWAGRGGTICGGQGRLLWSAPSGPPLVIADPPPKVWPSEGGRASGLRFLGYRIENKDAPPTFRYELAGAVIEERVDARIAPRVAAMRRFRFETAPNRTLLLRRDEKSSEPRALEGFTASEATIGDTSCYRLEPVAGASSYGFEVEILP